MSEPRDSQSSTPDLDDEVDGLLESLTGPDANGDLDDPGALIDRHSAKTEPPAPTPAAPAVTAPAPPPAPLGVPQARPAAPRPAIPRIARPASHETLKGKWPSMSPDPTRESLPTSTTSVTPAPPAPPARPLPRPIADRMKPPTGFDDDDIEAALMELGDEPRGTPAAPAAPPRGGALPAVPKAPPVPSVPEYGEDPVTVLADTTAQASPESFHPPMLDSAETLDDLGAIEVDEERSGAQAIPATFDSDLPRGPSPTLDIDGEDEAFFDSEHPAAAATEALFEEWEEEGVTTIHPPSAARTTEDSTVEFAATTLEDLGVDERSLSPSSAPPPRPSYRTTLSGLAQDPAQARPAAAHLGDSRLIDAWVARAEWFEEEAQGTADVQGRARLFLASSELWAMSGNVARARETARRAAGAAPSLGLANRQVRALDAVEGDFRSVAQALDVEARTAHTEVARAHAAYLAAEVQRLVLLDEEAADRKLDGVARTVPLDPRAHVMRIARELGAGAGAPKVQLPQDTATAELATAASLLSALRGGPRSGEPLAPLVAFEDARHALSIGDRDGAGSALARLGDVPGLGEGALWLAAALLAPSAEWRAQSIAALAALDRRAPSAAARRALAARALEQGDAEAMNRALASDDESDPAFGPEDRVALGALSGRDPAALAESALAVIENEPMLPLAAAATAVSAVTANLPVGDPEARARITLGRRLATVQAEDELKDAVHALRAAAPNAPLGRILSLELDAGAGATSAMAAELSRLAPPPEESGKLAAALIEEAAGRADAARRHYTAALGGRDIAEAAARAIMGAGDTNTATLLSTLSAALGEENTARQALLLFEAAAGGDGESEAEDLLERSHAAHPELPFASRLGADRARVAGDAPRLLSWLKRRQKAAHDPLLRALEDVRIALLVADEDPAEARSRAAAALEVRPDDMALHELVERLGPSDPEVRGLSRERLAQRFESPRTRSRLLFEAALEFARGRNREDATRAAKSAADTGGSELAKVFSEWLLKDGPPDPVEGLARLRSIEHAALGDTHSEADLVGVAASLADLPDAGEAAAHARLALRLRSHAEAWEAGRELLEKAARTAPKSLWALRERSAHARIARDDEAMLESERELMERSPRKVDAATLALRAAEAAARLGRKEEALALLARTLEAVPDHAVARSVRAALTEETDPAAAATDLEVLGDTSAVPGHQWEAFYRAAVLRLDKAGDADGGLESLELAAAIDVGRADVFDRLQLAYVQRGDRQKLADLLERRLANTHDPEERIALEVTRGKALSDIGDREAARKALSSALEANPDHADALETFAVLSAADGDAAAAEQAWIRLARIATDPERQATIYRKLAKLYDTDLPNPQRSEICYREILKRKPDDADALQSLVFVYSRLGDSVKALELATQLVDKAANNDEKRDRTLALSRVYDEAGKDKKSALQILERARKSWPHDSAVLRAAAEFHARHGETAAQSVLVDRASAEARRALSHGRYELSFFGILETCASLRGNADAANVAAATLAALDGKEEVAVRGAGSSAMGEGLDDLLAPELLSSPLRALLKKLPGVLDAAYPVDLKALRAGPIPEAAAELGREIRAVAESFGIGGLELYASPTLGPVFVPASAAPARLIVGQSLLDSDDVAARYFTLVRALKAMQAQASAFVRIAPIELLPAISALLSILAPSFVPQGSDPAKLAEAKRKVQAAMPARFDDAASTLALEAAGILGNRASQLGQACGQWGSRTALLAVGSAHVALRGVALALGQAGGPPETTADRVKWVLRHPEARDLTVFSVSDAYAEARKRVGLVE